MSDEFMRILKHALITSSIKLLARLACAATRISNKRHILQLGIEIHPRSVPGKRTFLDPKYAEQYRELYEKHWWWRARAELIIETLQRLRPSGWKYILDVGCG